MKSINLLDPAQQKTLEALLDEKQANALSIVYGPPGTGKSHLITSLLFELAIRKKKVLFVSQNTEALDVIIRKYGDIDKEMRKSKNDLCFLDFCLQLNNPACKKVKYLKEHKSVIMSQKMAPTYRPSASIDSDNNSVAPYKLSYTFLDAIQNQNSNEPGIDELLVYQMRYADDDGAIKDIIYDINDINLREVFNLLGEYQYANEFSTLVHPEDQLKYINRKNTSVSLTDIKSAVKQIESMLIDLPAKSFTVTSDMNIVDLLNYLTIVRRWQDFLDLKKIAENPNVLTQIIEDAGRIEDILASIHNCQSVEVSDYSVAYRNESVEKVENISNVGELADCAELSRNLCEQLSACVRHYSIDTNNFSVAQLAAYLLKETGYKQNATNIVSAARSLIHYNAQQLADLITELERWNSDLGLFSLKKKPTGNLGVITARSKEVAQYLYDNIAFLNYAQGLLEGTNYDLADLKKMSELKVNDSVFVPIRQASRLDADESSQLINLMLRIVNTGWCAKNEYCDETICLLDDFSNYCSFLEKNIELNKTKRFSSISEAAEIIRQNIENHNLYSEKTRIEEECKEYMANKNGDIRVFLSMMTSDFQIDVYNEISSRLDNLSAVIGVSSDKISKLATVVQGLQDEAPEKQIFNRLFFAVANGENFGVWAGRCKNMLTFNNIDRLTAFTDHNIFVERLKKELIDKGNAEIVDHYLDIDIDYGKFCNYLAQAIISTKIGSMKASSLQKIDKSFFKNYKNANYIERSSHYDHGLSILKNDYENPSLTLTKAVNATTGMHNIERFRKCTSQIVDAFPVIIATPGEVSKYLDAKRYFDYVVFDEASQLLPGQALPSLYRANRAIVVGDPHQMPPSLTTIIGYTDDDDDDIEEYGQSILDMIKGLQTANEYHLTTHYRSESNQLFEPSRKAIYEAEGIQPIFEAKSDRMPIFISDNLGADDNDGFDKIIQRLRYYLAHDSKTSFCLLFTRNDQNGLAGFRKYLDNRGTNLRDIDKLYDEGRLLMSSVQDCQGIEGDHTILYIPSYSSISSMWFFREKVGAYKRLNVAVTRQRKTLDLVMGDPRGKWLSECQRMQTNPTGPNQEKSAKLFTTLLSKAGREVDDLYLDEELAKNANSIDSPLTKQLYDKLCQHYRDRIGEDLRIWCEVGYKLNVPTGDAVLKHQGNIGYRIDIGIYSIRHRKFILGIEMDGSTYHSGFIKEFSDLQRQEILEMKGWNVYRIWSTNWIKDTAREFAMLTHEIDQRLDDPVEDEPMIGGDEFDNLVAETPSSEEVDAFETDEVDELEEVEVVEETPVSDLSPAKSRLDMDDEQFTNELIAICRTAKKNGTFIKIKRKNAPEFEDIMVHDVSSDLKSIMAKYGALDSFFKLKLDTIEAFAN